MKLVETLYGRHSKYQIFRTGWFMGPAFIVRKDGKDWYTCSTLSHAVEHVKSRGN